MDNVRGFEEDRSDTHDGVDEAGVGEDTLALSGDERRMHVRAYNHWVSLLRGRAYPSIEDLDPSNIVDFGAHSVLLDFSRGVENPTIQFLGKALREECGLDQSITHIAQVPSRSLLSRLTDHYLQIIANRAPIGFEAEFVGTRGYTTMYRGILMPFSSDEDSIDFIYGVINWKEVVDPLTQATLDAELEAAVRAASHAPAAPAWADGPSAAFEDAPEPATPAALGDRLMLARESAAAARASDTRSRAALYRALGRAHDFAIAAGREPDGYARLLDEAGIAGQARAPMTPIVKLVFGADYDKTRITEFAAVLAHAGGAGIPEGELGEFLGGFAGGIKAVVQAERAARRPAAKARAVPTLSGRATLAKVSIATDAAEGSLVVLVARAGVGGTLDIVGAVANNDALAARAVRAIG